MQRKHMKDIHKYLGKTVHIKIDRPLGSIHPKHKDILYPINYGYLPGTIGGDGEAQDVYLLGVDHPVEEYTAKVIAVVEREDDTEDKLVAAPDGMIFSRRQIRSAVRFQEKYFQSKVVLDPQRPVVTFYRGSSVAPKTTMPTHLGANAIITCNGKLLLEKRRDSDTWGLVGGGVKKSETARQAIVREIYEELGWQISPDKLEQLAIYAEPARIAAYRDGSIWRMVVVVFGLVLDTETEMRISAESKELRFFTKEELSDIEIVVTHSDIVDDWFTNRV